MVPCERDALEGDPAARRRHRRRRRRAQFRLPARHERARHGLGGRPGARVHRDGHALVQAAHAAAGDREAHAQRHRHPAARRAAAQRGGADAVSLINTDQLDRWASTSTRWRRSRIDRRQGHARRLLRPGGQADRAEHGRRDRARPGDAGPADLAASAASRPGATRPSSSRSARATCRSARRRWSTASRSSRR